MTVQRHHKKNRSNQYTTGLCNTFSGTDLKTLFFEVDKYDPRTQTHNENYVRELQIVNSIYRRLGLDYLVHKTQNGCHFLSPTMIPKLFWSKIIKEDLRDINRKCPMTTLRVEPNKYPNESEFWYRVDAFYFDGNDIRNNFNMCNYLNKIFGTSFRGSPDNNQDIKIVRYPLPEAR